MRAHCDGRRGPELPQRPGALGPLTILSAPNTNSHGECWGRLNVSNVSHGARDVSQLTDDIFHN